jgi:hypothetical protein
MRRGYNPEFLKINEDFVGVNLAAGYCAEHEWGITGIINKLKVDPVDFQTNCDDFSCVHFAVSRGSEKMAMLAVLDGKEALKQRGVLPMHGDNPKKFRGFRTELHPGNSSISAAWCGDEFAVLVKGRDNVSELKNVYASIMINDACVWLGGRSSNPFSRVGLCVAIRSRLPDELINSWRADHADKSKLRAASAATGIDVRLREAGKTWCALSPAWKTDQQTEHPVVYWFNPCDDRDANFGWFTVEQLEQWCVGEGPIPKEQACLKTNC